MTDEEMGKVLAEFKTEIANFPPDKEISNPEWRRKMSIVRKCEVLEKIQKARTDSDLIKETKLMAYYDLLVQEKSMNPILNYLLKIRLRSTTWM